MTQKQLVPFNEFIRTWRERDRGTFQDVDWTSRYNAAGYYKVILTDPSNWNEVHAWCEKEFGINHYSWNGANFWFETHEDAFRFVLRWGGE